jgi:hypothetical protein
MQPLTFDAYIRNPELAQALIRQAHRERTEAIYRFIVEPIKLLLAQGRRHATRAHLAAAR